MVEIPIGSSFGLGIFVAGYYVLIYVCVCFFFHFLDLHLPPESRGEVTGTAYYQDNDEICYSMEYYLR